MCGTLAQVSGGERPDRRGSLAAASHPARRDGVIALGAFLLPWVVALIQVLRHRPLHTDAVGVLAGASVGLAGLWLAWAGFRDTSRSTRVSGLTMAQVAGQLAVAVGARWEAEVDVRRLN